MSRRNVVVLAREGLPAVVAALLAVARSPLQRRPCLARAIGATRAVAHGVSRLAGLAGVVLGGR
jgi:hypothetical protein